MLLDLTGGATLAEAAAGWKHRVEVVAARPAAQPCPAVGLLIRPDGYVAWAGKTDTPGRPDLGGLQDALSRWFGA